MNDRDFNFAHEAPRCPLFPANLTDWINPCDLVGVVLTVVQSVDDVKLESTADMSEARFLPPRLMLTLLTYCYAVGMNGSREIQRQSQVDEALRYLCVRQHPKADFLRRFRNRNREALAGCLAAVLYAVTRRRLGLARSARLLHLTAWCEARERLSLAEAADMLTLETEPGQN